MMELTVEPHRAARAHEGGLGPYRIGRTRRQSCSFFNDLILVGAGTQRRPAPGAPHPLPGQVSGYGGALAEIVVPAEAVVVSPTQARARRRPR